MSKPQQPRRQAPAPVAQPQAQRTAPAPQRTVAAAPRVRTPSIFANQEMIYSKRNYQIMLGGLALIAIGMLLMLGGRMPSNDVWDPGEIYSFRRITLAPISMLAGFGVILYGIFYEAPRAAISNYKQSAETDEPTA
jgi:Protein of unknown function (DUF3098)